MKLALLLTTMALVTTSSALAADTQKISCDVTIKGKDAPNSPFEFPVQDKFHVNRAIEVTGLAGDTKLFLGLDRNGESKDHLTLYTSTGAGAWNFASFAPILDPYSPSTEAGAVGIQVGELSVYADCHIVRKVLLHTATR